MDAVKLEQARRSKPFRPADIILFAAVIAFTAAVTLSVFRHTGDTVTVTMQGGETKSYPLEENRVVDLGVMKLFIEDGAVWVTDADCPDKVCEHSGRIRYEHQSIVCLPNKITITITGGGSLNGSTGQA